MQMNSKAPWPTKLRLQLATMLLPLFGFFAQLSNTYGQGNLAPSGPPAPTMKSLDQIEPRKPISSLPYTITLPGPYYVTTNLTGAGGTNGITIAANDVTLNLGGFSLIGAAGSIDGILVSGARTNIWILNGTIRGWGLDNIDALNSQASVFTDLRVVGSGNTGLRSGTGAVVTRCATIANNQEGILAFNDCRISQCVSLNNGAAGFATGNDCCVKDCTAANNFDGISAGADSSIIGCTTRANLNFGISVSSDSVVTACAASGNNYIGISMQGANSLVKACVASSNATGGIVLYGRYSTVEGCTANGNLYVGIQLNADGCVALNNTCDSNGTGSPSNAGLASFGVSGCGIDANHFSNNSHRALYLDASSTHNVITRNVVISNSVQTVSYDLNATNNDVGPIGRASATFTGPWANVQY